MTVPQFAAMREARRATAAQLRAQGMPIRAIAAQLGVSHPTIVEDLRVPATTAPTTAPTPVPAATRSRYSEAHGWLLALLSALAAVGLTEQLAPARELLARAREVEQSGQADRGKLRAERAELAGRVVTGELTYDLAAARDVELAALLSGDSDGFATTVAERYRDAAADAARADAFAVADALAERAAGAVSRAVGAGRRLLDVPATVAALRRAADAWRAGAGATDSQGRSLARSAPERAAPPLSLEVIQGDPARLAAWGEAGAALAEFAELRGIVGLLGMSSGIYVNPDQTVLEFLERDVAEPARLAVADALGWRPGLHVSMKPGQHRQSTSDGTEIHGDVRYPAGWAAGLVAPRVGPRR